MKFLAFYTLKSKVSQRRLLKQFHQGTMVSGANLSAALINTPKPKGEWIAPDGDRVLALPKSVPGTMRIESRDKKGKKSEVDLEVSKLETNVKILPTAILYGGKRYILFWHRGMSLYAGGWEVGYLNCETQVPIQKRILNVSKPIRPPYGVDYITDMFEVDDAVLQWLEGQAIVKTA